MTLNRFPNGRARLPAMAAYSDERGASPKLHSSSRPRWPGGAFTAAFAVCLFLLIAGAKWAIFDQFGSPMPDWDQWDAEGSELLIPWFDQDHFVTHLFNPHNEHRVVVTKLHALGLALLNGQWDSRLEAVTNATLHALLGVTLWLASCRWTARPWRAPFFLLCAALFGLPIAWQNVLGGFHSQQYWLLGLSFAAIVTLPFARPWSSMWWVGAVAALLALGSMGSGLLASAVVLTVLAWRMGRREASFSSTWPTLTIAALAVGVGVVTRVAPAWHEKLKVTTLHDFVFSIVHSLQWPLREQDWAAGLMWAPWCLAAWRVVRTAPTETMDVLRSRAGETIVALGGWVLVQVFATAYARGAGADYPASRYMDTLAFGAFANALALVWLLSAPPRRSAGGVRIAVPRRHTALLSAIGMVWLLTLSIGVYNLLHDIVQHELRDARKYYTQAEGHMRRYLATNDGRQLAHGDIPFPSAEELIARLAHPRLRAMMPAPIRAPLTLSAAAGSTGFAANDARFADPEQPPRTGLSPETAPLDAAITWGSFGTGGTAAMGVWRSGPLMAALAGYLKFEVAGHVAPGSRGVSLQLRDASNDALLADVRPTRVPGNNWRAAYVRTPTQPFVIVAEDRDDNEWLAFSGPTEMGELSHWARQATRHGLLITYFAGGATVLLGIAALVTARQR
jgi:hypothetical protein